MCKILLHKYSIPGWTKEFDSVNQARLELLKHICTDCLNGDQYAVGVDEPYHQKAPNIFNINELLGTSCGLEYGYEEIDK
jgi:hypothetical protein